MNPSLPTLDELIALRLVDPIAADRDDRVALVHFLLTRGVSLDEVVRSHDVGDLVGLSVDRAVRPGVRLTRAEVARSSGVEAELLERLHQASGLSDPGPEVAAFTASDVAAAQSFESLSLLFGEAVALQLMRVTGAALGRIAEAAVSAYMVNVHAPLQSTSAGDLATAHAFAQVAAALPNLAITLDAQLRHHIEAAVHQFVLTHRGAVGSELVEVAVAFTDLVGSTAWSRSLTPTALASAIGRFNTLANEIALANGGRLMKLIGDEAMFVAADTGAACEIALELVAQCRSIDELPPVRGGVARGEVVTRDGDFHGPVVHLASRLVKQAEPDRVVVTDEVARSLPDGVVRVSARARHLRGFDEPIEVVEIRHAVGADTTTATATAA